MGADPLFSMKPAVLAVALLSVRERGLLQCDRHRGQSSGHEQDSPSEPGPVASSLGDDGSATHSLGDADKHRRLGLAAGVAERIKRRASYPTNTALFLHCPDSRSQHIEVHWLQEYPNNRH